MKVKRTYKHACMGCERPTIAGDGRRYIFPIPAKYNPKPNDGAYACSKCAPKIQREQKADGHMGFARTAISV